MQLAQEHAVVFRDRAPSHDTESSFPNENFADLASSGVAAAFVPEALGGAGLDSVHDWAVLMTRLGEGDASTAIALNMHLAVTRNLSQQWRGATAAGNDEGTARAEGPLRAIAAGELVICATATEAGTDFLRPQTTATKVDGGWSIEGRKLFVTMSPIAHLMVMNLRVPDPEGDKIGFAFVPMPTAGLEPQDDWQALGMRGSGSQSIVFRDCRVPEGSVQVAGEWGRWNPQILMGRTLGNLTLVAVFAGIAHRARQLAVEGALKQGKPKYGGALANSTGVQHLIGEIDIDLAAATSVLGTTAAGVDSLLSAPEGPPSLEDAHACMRDYQCAKWTVNRNAIRIVERSMDVCGGGSYMSSHELSRLYRDARAGPFMQPFSPIEAREYVGRVALGLLPDG
ncbi:MAG: acyl-CoA dehydrogenase family protein [Acidobacteriota bacterium]|nr:acyl-CoA dehydrogenase family protein [Acidobacteriota bacterium]